MKPSVRRYVVNTSSQFLFYWMRMYASVHKQWFGVCSILNPDTNIYPASRKRACLNIYEAGETRNPSALSKLHISNSISLEQGTSFFFPLSVSYCVVFAMWMCDRTFLFLCTRARCLCCRLCWWCSWRRVWAFSRCLMKPGFCQEPPNTETSCRPLWEIYTSWKRHGYLDEMGISAYFRPINVYSCVCP